MASSVRVVIYDAEIWRMSLPGGQIFRWTLKRRERVQMKAIINAPMRTGRLRGSIRGVYRPRGPGHLHMEVHAGAQYGLWVHEGTRAEITAHGPWQMGPLPPWGVHDAKYLWVVKGQKSQPFLRNALESVMRGEL